MIFVFISFVINDKLKIITIKGPGADCCGVSTNCIWKCLKLIFLFAVGLAQTASGSV